MNKNVPLDQIQDSEVSETDIDAVIDTNKELFDQLNSIPEIKACLLYTSDAADDS